MTITLPASQFRAKNQRQTQDGSARGRRIMDVGDFVGDSDEDSGVEDVLIEPAMPALEGAEPFVVSQGSPVREIEAKARSSDGRPVEDAPPDHPTVVVATELLVATAHPVVIVSDLSVPVEGEDSSVDDCGLQDDRGEAVAPDSDDREVEDERPAPPVVDKRPIPTYPVIVSDLLVPAEGEDSSVDDSGPQDDRQVPDPDDREVEDEHASPEVVDGRPITTTAEPLRAEGEAEVSVTPPDGGGEPVQSTPELLREQAEPVEEEQAEERGPRAKFNVGDIVHVAARTWPGINKLGGAGKIASVITETSEGEGAAEFLYNVKYMLGGFEKRIEEEYIQDLADALETGVRQHKERVFYHDEFAVDPHKKAKPLELERGEFWPQPEIDPSSESAPAAELTQEPQAKKSKKERDSTKEKPVLIDAPEIEFQLRSSDDSDYDGNDFDGTDKQSGAGSGRRLREDAFILDERHTAAIQRKPRPRDHAERSRRRREKQMRSRRRDEGDVGDKGRSHVPSKTSARKKRSHRIIESDNEDEDDRADSETDRHHGKKQRRYIGGYEHGTSDGSFIQPEGNPTELPDDVAEELQFKLGKTKAELRAQLDSFADRLLENLTEFDEKRRILSRQLDHSVTLQDSELQSINTTLKHLQGFVRKNLIRSGEDAMNAVIKKLERKGGSLPERIGIRYDDWLRKISDHDLWVKENLRSLDSTFAHRGLEPTVVEDASDANTSSESDEVGGLGSDSFNCSGDDVDDFEPNGQELPRRRAKSSLERGNMYDSGSRRSSAESNLSSKKRPRSTLQTQSSMDQFAVPFDERLRREQFNRPSAPVMSNFRFVREKDLLKRSTDPRWDWVRKLKRTRAKELGNPRGESLQHQRDPSAVTKSAKEGPKAISVMEAVLKLRDKRYRTRASPPTQPQYARQARSTLLPKPMPLLQQQSSYGGNSIEYEEPIRYREPTVHVKPSSPVLVPQKPSRKWASIFSVLPNEEMLPTSLMTSPRKLMRLGQVMYADLLNRDEDGCWSTLIEEDVHHDTQVPVLAQRLNQLRYEEHKAIAEISETASDISFKDNPSWDAVSTLGEEYHADLASLVKRMQRAVYEAHPAEVVGQVKSMIVDLSTLLKLIPDCNTIFSGSPVYGYYFEVACPGARSTPLILAICRTFWYAIQALVHVKQACEKHWPAEGVPWQELFVATLPPNRVALAATLFLVDLFIHVHSTHDIPAEYDSSQESSDSTAPGLSLWLLLHELFSMGFLQSTKGTDAKSNGGFWNFLQEAYRKRFIDEVALSFVKQESCCGYVKERAPLKTQGHGISDEDSQGRLLANDTLWDICGVLGNIFHSASYPNSTPPTWSSWTLLKELLSSGDTSFVPLEGLTATDIMDDEFKVQAYGFQIRMLRRVLVFSATWAPDKDFMEKLLSLLWETSLVDENDEVSLAVVNFIGEIRTLDTNNAETLLELVNRHATQTTNPVTLFCKIAVIQLATQEKAILRTRYRQPVLRALSSRLESQKDTRNLISQSLEPSKIQQPIEITKNDANKSWNWGKSGSKAVPVAKSANTTSAAQSVTPSTFQREQIITESKTMLSILLMFALSSVYLDDEANATHQTPRRQKELKREIEYFCKEFSSVGSGIPAVSVQLCQCIHAFGVAALDTRSSYSTAFEHLNSQLKWNSDELQQVRRMETDNNRQKTHESLSLSGGVSACIAALRDLSSQLIARLRVRRDVDPVEIETVQSCVTSSLGAGIAASLELASEGALSRSDFEKAIEILGLWIPRSRDSPSQCLRYGPSLQERSSQQDEFDEFDDAEMMDLLATVDLANPVASTTDYDAFLRSVDTQASDLAIANLRLPVQRLLISLPQRIWRSDEELYMLDLLGAMVASCSFTFSWNVVSIASLKARNFAPRLLGAILKHRPEKEWFSTCFLSEQNADVEVSNIWLTATLDLQSLLMLQSSPAPAKSSDQTSSSGNVTSARYSSYWLMLTDGIVANLLKENPVVRYKMDPLMYQLLLDTSTRCSFRQSITRNADPRDTGALYSLHEDVFRAFCRSAGSIWTSMTADPARHRADMNRFRSKMMDAQRGVFVALPDAYEVNLRSVCTELDSKNINWYSLSSRFLDEFSAPQGTKSLHAVDDAATVLDRELKDPVIRPLVVLFKLMYDCVDAFLFNCGGMAIGQQNIFYSIIELMFRQARCAEFPVAERRLKQTSSSHVSIVTRPSAASGIQGVSPACSGFVESARLFFAYQKYPSLMNWFAQNLETYQTLKAGWEASPLRVLLYNIFDPHGPLGIHSYYPIQDSSSAGGRFEPGTIRREAFYLACGLVNCRCTTSYEHTRHAPHQDQEQRRAQLRRFILTRFVDELKRSVRLDGENIDETLLPVLQFIKAFVNHLNLDDRINVEARDGSSHSQIIDKELYSGLASAAEHITATVRADSSLAETMSCVLMIEFCRIIEEVACLNTMIHDAKLTQFVRIGLHCASLAYESLRTYSSTVMEDLFVVDTTLANIESLADTVREFDVRDVKVKTEISTIVKIEAASPNARTTPDDYGISKVRVRSDLLSSIRRLVKKCSELGESSQLRGQPAVQDQVSEVGTM